MTGDVINQSLQYFLEQEHLVAFTVPSYARVPVIITGNCVIVRLTLFVLGRYYNIVQAIRRDNVFPFKAYPTFGLNLRRYRAPESHGAKPASWA